MWMPLWRASRLDGVRQLRGSWGHWRWRRRRTPRRAPAQPRYEPSLDDSRVIHTGFAALDAILGPGGLPKSASVAIRGDGSSGRTTLSLRVAAEAQAQGSVVAWLDLSRSFDPVEAVARGIRLEWLVVITPASLDEGLSIAGSLLTGRSVDMLVLDLPGGRLAKTDKPAKVADRLHRLAALARRAETLLLILDAPGLAGGLATAVAESTGIRLELARRSWVRLGRDVVGQRTEAHRRAQPPRPAGAQGDPPDPLRRGRRTGRLSRARRPPHRSGAARGAHTGAHPRQPARGPRSKDPRPCDVSTSSSRICPSTWRGPDAPSPSRPARSSSAAGRGTRGRSSTPTGPLERWASGAACRWRAPIDSSLRRPSSSPIPTRTG